MIDFGMVLGLRGGNIGPFWGDFRSNFDRMLAAISCSAFALLGPRFASLVLAFLPFRLACSSKVRGDRAGKPGEKPQANARNAPSSKRPARPRSGRARAYAIVLDCWLEALAALAALAWLLVLLLALWLSLFLLLSLLLPCLACLRLSLLPRFPFHDSQVYFWSQKAWYLQCFSYFWRK